MLAMHVASPKAVKQGIAHAGEGRNRLTHSAQEQKAQAAREHEEQSIGKSSRSSTSSCSSKGVSCWANPPPTTNTYATTNLAAPAKRGRVDGAASTTVCFNHHTSQHYCQNFGTARISACLWGNIKWLHTLSTEAPSEANRLQKY